ncbi:hypothetical protein ZEAMMB73_Zm00001d051481 [Zea mays]|uniref:Uncharacterized protein n=1 Tax=Zea mays TaxID=4577 RepID=A0A1D6Q755_MAIZE|nr:hypothetical protein ZEAMMB73_Zm00001d051481 [Zea mays]
MGCKVLMEPIVLNRERATTAQRKRMPMLFDDYRDEDFYGLPRKYSIVARVEVKFPIEPRFRDRQHFILSDINGAKIEAITYMYETVKHFDNLLHGKHVYKMHNVKFSLHPGEFNFRHLNGPMELCLDQQTIVEPYTVPIQMAPFPKQILLNLADIAELPNRTLVDIMAIVVHLDTIHRTMWGPFRKIVIMDARGYLHIIKSASSLRIIPQYTSIRSITTPIILDQFKKLWWRGTTVSLLLHFLKNKGVDRFYKFAKSNNWDYA